MGELPLCKRAVIGSNPIASILALLLTSSSSACNRHVAESPAPPSPLVAERRALHAAEADLLWSQAQAALAGGVGVEAARAVKMGLALDAARFEPLLPGVLELVGPAIGQELLAGHDPARAAALAEQAEREAVRALHAEGGVPEGLVGVRRAHGRTAMAGVVAEYLEAVDPARLAEAAHQRLAWVAEARGLPALAPKEAKSGDAVIDAAIRTGMPEPVAVGEGVNGALASLDAYTRAIWPPEIQAWTQHHAGVVVGVGLELVDGPDGGVIVSLPVVNGAAWRAGIHQGDRLVSVGGTQVTALASPRAEAAMAKLAGEPGSPVVLELVRGSEPLSVTLTREATSEVTVHGWRRGPSNTWVPGVQGREGLVLVRISAFRPETDEAFDALLEGVSPSGVVLDLRGNHGGDVMAAANVADRFVADGTVAALSGRTIAPQELAEGEVAWNTALPGHPLESVPVVVVVDEETASSAELLAGALRERRGAKLVGATTFGKGLSQALRADESVGVAWQVTTGVWSLPSGRPLEGGASAGLEPDLSLPLSAAERFLVRVLREQREHPTAHSDGSPMVYVGPVGREDLPTLSADPQLEAAFTVLAGSGPSRR